MKKILPFISVTILLIIPFFAFAQSSSYQPLIQLPINPNGTTGWEGYIDSLYATAISLAALIAVIKIIVSGAKLMFSDVVPTKSAAKEEIQGTLLGLLLILGAVVLLNLINPKITKTDINTPKIKDTPVVQQASGIAPARTTPPASGGGGTAPATGGTTGGAKPAPAPSGVPAPAPSGGAPTPIIKTIGSVAQNGSTVSISQTRPANEVNDFKISCHNKKGVYSYIKTSNIWSCKTPTIITYPSATGSAEGQIQRTDCDTNKGKYDSGTLGFGKRSCVI